MQFSEEFIKKLKKVYPYSNFPEMAKRGNYRLLQQHLEETDAPSISCEEILEYINDKNISALKEYAEQEIKNYEERQELYAMFLDEVENATGISFEF